MMRDHFLNGLLAVVFSVLIWCAVGAQMSTRDTTRIDFEVEVPRGLIVSYEGRSSNQGRLVLQDVIAVTVRGPKEQIDRLGQARLPGRFPLASLPPEQLQRHLEAGYVPVDPKRWIRAEPPLEVIETNPPQLRLELQRVIEAERWVVPGEVLGSPAPGNRKGEVRVTPRRVVVRGPARILNVDPEQPYPTEPIDLAGAEETFTVERSVRCPEGVSAGQRVQVRVEILPEVVVRGIEFPVQFLRTASREEPIRGLPFKVEPIGGWRRKLKIAGPDKALKSLEDAMDRARLLGQFSSKLPIAYVTDVDLPALGTSGQPLQDHLTVEVSGLPEGLEYVEKESLSVRLVPE